MRSIIIAFIASFLMLADLRGQWEIVSNDFYTPPQGWSFGCIDVCFINQTKGYILGNQYQIMHKWTRNDAIVFRTNDGGKTWNGVFTVSSTSLSDRFRKCIFIDNLNGFVTSNMGLFRTYDGGDTWIKKDNGLPFIKDLFFVNEHIGFAGTDTSIYKTTNGGEFWERIFNFNTGGVFSIFFMNDITGWAVGEAGLILKLTDKGTSEKIASGTTLPLKKVFFSDSRTGWVAGGYNNTSDGLHPVLLKTVNGGESWSKIENINWLINDFFFRNNQEGWAVGSDSTGKGIIVETKDGGNNWSVQIDSLGSPLIATCFKDGYGWAVGRNGLVLKKDFSIITGINDNNEIYNDNTILFQNYPNPFSSETVISYQLPVINNIELGVFDITGRKVTTLVRERQQPGRYDAEWNAEGITPGLYLYELKDGQIRQVRKMIKIK